MITTSLGLNTRRSRRKRDRSNRSATLTSELAERLREKYFGKQDHPYRIFERTVEHYLRPEHTLLDAGCGRTAPVLIKYRGKAKRLIGIDLVDFAKDVTGVELLANDLSKI